MLKKTAGGMLLALTTALTAAPAHAEFPEAPVTVIVPYGSGGGTDTGVRTWAPYFQSCLGANAQVVVVNKPGAGATIGIAELATSKPDGYTIGILNSPNFYTYGLSRPVPWTTDSFEYLGALIGVRSAVAVRPDSPFKTMADLVEAAKKLDKPMNFGVSGIGGDDQLTNHRFAAMAGIKFNFVPLDGDANTRNALLGGHIDVIGVSDAAIAPFVSEIRPLAVAANERSPLLPDVATFKEQGFELVAGSNHIVGAPAGTPPEVAAKLADCLQKASQDEGFLADAKKRSLPLLIMDAAQAKKHVVDDAEAFKTLWAKDPWTTQ